MSSYLRNPNHENQQFANNVTNYDVITKHLRLRLWTIFAIRDFCKYQLRFPGLAGGAVSVWIWMTLVSTVPPAGGQMICLEDVSSLFAMSQASNVIHGKHSEQHSQVLDIGDFE